MGILTTGIVIWCATHLFPAVAPGRRQALLDRLGRGPYRGLFSLLILASLVLIVIGWKSTLPRSVYAPPLSGGIVVSGMVLLAFILFVASQAQSNVKRLIRHPQLTGIVLWAAAHLLTNGDNRSLLLFGALGGWAIVEIGLISRRDGPRDRPPAAPFVIDMVVLLGATVAFGVILFFHLRLFGVAPMAL